MTTTIELEPGDDGTGRYVATLDGEEAGELTFRTDAAGHRVFVHTGVEERFEGHGLAGQLATRALDDARAEGLKIVPQCPYVRSFLERHRDYLDLVAP